MTDLLNKPHESWDEQGEQSQESGAVYKPLSREEARILKEKAGGLSLQAFLLKVLVWQVVAGCAAALGAWLLSASVLVGQSALYGAFCVVLPSAVVVRMVLKQISTGDLQLSGGILARFFVLELVKIVVTACMLLLAPVVLGAPNWIAVVAGFVVTLKVYWVVAFLGLGRAGHVASRVKKIGIIE